MKTDLSFHIMNIQAREPVSRHSRAYNADEMINIIWYAMQIYYDRKDEWKKIVDNGMAVDYSWNVSADKYISLVSRTYRYI